MTATQGSVAIQAVQLSKFYGNFAAIQDVSFEVPRGQVAAFLGPNGAGKSTTLKILTGFLHATKGSAKIAGLDVTTDRIAAASKIGYLPENGPLYPQMTPLELLRFFGEARGLAPERLASRVDAVVEQCNLQSVLEKAIHKLSKGYRQRVGMAQALLHEPDILIMDEPTAGLDPNQIREVRSLIRDLSASKTVLISTHILQEVEAVADHVVIIHEGRIVFDGTPGEMADGGGLEAAFHRLTQGSSGQSAEAETATAAQAEPSGETAEAGSGAQGGVQ
jgi:ABC-2 type transport system ATP-binding protein